MSPKSALGTACSDIAALETILFKKLGAQGRSNKRAIFILGAPRTGSTIFYQAIAAYFSLPFLSNLTNTYFPKSPIVGLSIQAAYCNSDGLVFESRYGKVPGDFQPSEASMVMAHWFGGGHPSQTVSKQILPEREDQFLDTLAAAECLFGKPLVIKNAWNCFRVDYLAKTLPDAAFLWIKRDLVASSKSDLRARYVVQGDPCVWNSATPANVDVLRLRPYWEQVVENQYEFSRAISSAGKKLPKERFLEVWYEDFQRDSAAELARIGNLCGPLRSFSGRVPSKLSIRETSDGTLLTSADATAIEEYVQKNRLRFADLIYPSPLLTPNASSVV